MRDPAQSPAFRRAAPVLPMVMVTLPKALAVLLAISVFAQGCATPSPYRAQAKRSAVLKLAPETVVEIAKGPRKRRLAVKNLEGGYVTLTLATTRVKPVVRGRETRWFGPDFWAGVNDTRLFISDKLGRESFPLEDLEYVASSWVRENPNWDRRDRRRTAGLGILDALCVCLVGGLLSF